MAGGRPSLYSAELANIICGRLMSGESLRSISRDPAMPDLSTVLLWCKVHPEFSFQYAQAREIQADVEFDAIEELAATATPEDVQCIRLQVDTRKWSLARKSRKYHDKVIQELTGKDGGAIETVDKTPDEIARQVAFLLAKGSKE